MRVVVGDAGITNYLPFIVDCVGVTITSTQCPQIGYGAVVVDESVRLAVIRGRGDADDLSGVVDGAGLRECSAQRADVHHRSTRISKGMGLAGTQRGFTDGHSRIIQGNGGAVITAESAQVEHRPVDAEECVIVENFGQRVTGNLAQLVKRRDIGSAAAQIGQIGHRPVGIKERFDRGVSFGQ